MAVNRTYRPRRTTRKSEETRARIVAAVRALLVEGVYHERTVEEVADRAGVSRATLYQHFASRLDLVDAICDTLTSHPALLALNARLRLRSTAPIIGTPTCTISLSPACR